MRVDEAREPGEEWGEYVTQRSTACPSHDPRWGRVFRAVFGHSPVYLRAEEAGETMGVLPLMTISRALLGRIVVSMPYLNHGGICASSPQARDALVAKAVELGREENARWLELRHEDSVDWGMAVRQHKVAMRLALPNDPGALFAAFPAKLRSQIRRAEKAGMSVRSGGLEEVAGFYRVFSRNMRDLGTPVYPRRFFEKVMEAFSETARIITVCHDSREVASGLVVGFKDRLEIPWASSIREYNQFGVNMLLYWSALEYACKHGYHVFDFGRSTLGGGTYRFKEQWGARPVPLYWYYWLAPGQRVPDVSPTNPRYEWAIRVWRRVPLAVANVLGPYIVRHLPS